MLKQKSEEEHVTWLIQVRHSRGGGGEGGRSEAFSITHRAEDAGTGPGMRMVVSVLPGWVCIGV